MATLLAITVLLPIVGSLVLRTDARARARTARLIGLSFTLATLALSLILLIGFHTDVVGPQFAFSGSDGR